MEHRTNAPSRGPKDRDWLEYRRVREQRDHYLASRHGDKPPEKFLVRADHFLRLFNEDFNLKGDKALSRRTLQFYSSPQAKLMPLPVYKNRHTAYYNFPDDYGRLGVIWTLRSRFFFPIELVRSVLERMHPDMYAVVPEWDRSPQELLDAVAMDKAGFEPEDFDRYTAAKGLIGDESWRFLARDFSPAEAKKTLLRKLDAEHAAAREWIVSGRGIEFWRALVEARREQPELGALAGKGSADED
jgi:hypothetical protein